jgi:Uma2 family endonuclease
MKFPAPDFIAEVLSDSTEANDRGVKFDDYAAHGVREYWLIDPESRVVEQYDLMGDVYGLRLKLNAGLLQSRVIEGFEIPVGAIFDEGENLAALRALLA